MAVELKQVAKHVGSDTHIYPTDLSLQEAEFTVLLGSTLAGKTTLLRLMAGLEVPSEGEVWFRGANVTGVAVQKRRVAMVYQQFINYPNYTVFDNISSPLRVEGMKRKDIKKRVGEVAELLKLTPMLDRLPSELSGGQQQRTALARALVKDTDLVLLDEPLANLDYKLREELRDELPKLFRSKGATVVYATTEPSEALLLGGYTATLHEGRVTQYGRTADVYRQPTDLISAQVFSDPPLNVAVAVKSQGQWRTQSGLSWAVREREQHLADGEYTVGFRPHHLTLGPALDDQSVSVTGQVLVSEITGSESVVHVKIGADTWVSLSRGVHSMQVGESAPLSLNTAQCFYFEASGQCVVR